MRLKTHIRAAALLRQAEARGLFGTVLRRGDPDGGVLFALARDGAEVALFAEDGRGLVRRATEPATQEGIEDALRREGEFDRDLWVVEIEGRCAAALLTAFEA